MGKVGEIEAKAAWARWVRLRPKLDKVGEIVTCFGGQSCMDKVGETDSKAGWARWVRLRPKLGKVGEIVTCFGGQS